MCKFTEGYQLGVKSITGEKTQDDVYKTITSVWESGGYEDSVAWFNGFYKGMLDMQLEALKKVYDAE